MTYRVMPVLEGGSVGACQYLFHLIITIQTIEAKASDTILYEFAYVVLLRGGSFVPLRPTCSQIAVLWIT